MGKQKWPGFACLQRNFAVDIFPNFKKKKKKTLFEKRKLLYEGWQARAVWKTRSIPDAFHSL